MRANRSNQQKSSSDHVDNSAFEISVGETGYEETPVVTFKTWVVIVLLACGYGLCFYPVPVMAAIGAEIASEVNAPRSEYWFIPAWTLSVCVNFMLSGANTDLLGRRWFIVGGNLVSVIGHIIVASATGKAGVIAGMAITGFGGANAQMAVFAVGELLPNKWRHIGVVISDVSSFTISIVAPVTARLGSATGTWRWNWGGCAIVQGLVFFGLLFLYFPPAHPYGISKRKLVKELDYVGAFLFVLGAVPALMGLVWTTVYPSSDAHIVATLTVGFAFILAFALWEIYGNAKHPLTPTRIFTSGRGRDFTAPCIGLAIINMFYFSQSILWPTMISVWYTDIHSTWKYAALLSTVQGFAIAAGALVLAFFGRKIRSWYWQLVLTTTVMVSFGTLLALCTPQTKGMAIGFTFISAAAYGWAIYLSIAVSQLGVEQKDLGISGGVSGSARFASGSIASAAFTTILVNAVTTRTQQLVPPAALNAGLPESELSSLLAVAANNQVLFSEYSPAIATAVRAAVQQAYVHGIQLLCYASLAFGFIGIIATAFCKDVDARMTDKIEIYLENTKNASKNTYH